MSKEIKMTQHYSLSNKIYIEVGESISLMFNSEFFTAINFSDMKVIEELNKLTTMVLEDQRIREVDITELDLDSMSPEEVLAVLKKEKEKNLKKKQLTEVVDTNDINEPVTAPIKQSSGKTVTKIINGVQYEIDEEVAKELNVTHQHKPKPVSPPVFINTNSVTGLTTKIKAQDGIGKVQGLPLY